MAEICIKIPDELKRQAEESDLDISEIVIQFIKHKSKSEDLKRFKKLVSKSRLSEKDAKELADKIDKALSKRFLN